MAELGHQLLNGTDATRQSNPSSYFLFNIIYIMRSVRVAAMFGTRRFDLQAFQPTHQQPPG
jgi:hypothetical protein